MQIDAKILARFGELGDQSTRLPRDHIDGVGYQYRPEAWRQWATSAHHLLQSVFGIDSLHDRNFSQAYGKTHSGWESDIQAMRGVFNAARADYEAGFAFNVRAAISGEIYGDFVGLAKRALDEGSKDVAAVLACAALEDALKRMAQLHGLDVDGKVMQEVVNALKTKGLVQGAQKTLLDSMPRIRDQAMHADWGKITPESVGGVIGFVEQLLLREFS